MLQSKVDMFRNRLVKVARHLGKQARKQGVTCYRIYDHDLPEFPICIERYGEMIYVAEYKRRHGLSDEAHEQWLAITCQVISEVLEAPAATIFVKLRQRKPGRLGQYEKIDGRQQRFPVQENGLTFFVNMTDYLDTGLFLDHRITRQLVREQAPGKSVLNLFAYTGSFSVYAAAGGATEVVTVDLSKTYLQWAQDNMAANELRGNFSFVHADVKQYLPTLPAGHFDLVIMDPPTFSNSQRMEDILDTQRDHVQLINGCLAAMKPGGQLFFSTNYRKFELDAAGIRASSIRDITKATTPFDFVGRFSRFCFLITC